jgi:hypothetical protein
MFLQRHPFLWFDLIPPLQARHIRKSHRVFFMLHSDSAQCGGSLPASRPGAESAAAATGNHKLFFDFCNTTNLGLIMVQLERL